MPDPTWEVVTSDTSAQVITASVIPVLTELGTNLVKHTPNGGDVVMRAISDKGHLLEIAREAGVPVPRQIVIERPGTVPVLTELDDSVRLDVVEQFSTADLAAASQRQSEQNPPTGSGQDPEQPAELTYWPLTVRGFVTRAMNDPEGGCAPRRVGSWSQATRCAASMRSTVKA